MLRKSFIFSLICSLGFSSLSVASEPKYVEHPFHLKIGPVDKPTFEYSKRRTPNDFADYSYPLEVANYYNWLAFSGKKTLNGYYYSQCEYEIRFILEIKRTPTETYIPVLAHSDYYNSLEFQYFHPPSVKFVNSRPNQSSISAISILSSQPNLSGTLNTYLTEAILRSDRLNFSPINVHRIYRWYGFNIRVRSNLTRHIYRKYGCHLILEEDDDNSFPSCPNLFIRGLPFLRNTVTCILKNR